MNQEEKDDLELRTALEPCWFRVEADHYDYGCSRLAVIDIPVIKHTPRGAWVMRKGQKFLVLRDYTHRGRAYAAPSIVQAMEDFRHRKQFQISRLKQELRGAESELALLETGKLRLLDHG